MEQQATDRVSLELLASRDPTPLTGNDFNLMAAEVYEVKKRPMNHINLTQIHHRTKPSLLFWIIFQKTTSKTAKMCASVLPVSGLCVLWMCGKQNTTSWASTQWMNRLIRYCLLYKSGQVNQKIQKEGQRQNTLKVTSISTDIRLHLFFQDTEN